MIRGLKHFAGFIVDRKGGWLVSYEEKKEMTKRRKTLLGFTQKLLSRASLERYGLGKEIRPRL